MTADRRAAAGPVGELGATAVLRALPAGAVRLGSGFWFERVTEAGTLDNLRLAAGTAEGAYHGRLPFLDTDVYKWLEAVSWHLQTTDSPAWSERAEEVIALVAAAQHEDGYINSYTTVVRGGERWADLPAGHEMYCAGHLIQA